MIAFNIGNISRWGKFPDWGYFQIGVIPAKKWGDTEIAERGRSVLVMRARYRSAGLILHQRGWTDAG